MAAELAMHFEKARDYPRAVHYLQKAAENASRRFANQETLELSRRGLELLKLLPDRPERSQQELMLQISFAFALAATQGYGATEVEEAYSLARALCQRLGDNLQLFPVLWGLWRFYLIRSDLKTAGELAHHLLELAQRGQDPALSVEAHLAAGTTFDNRGEFDSARRHFEEGISLYRPQQQHAHLLQYGHDPRAVLRCFNAWAIWSLGYPDLARETAHQAVALAEDLRHPETLCYSLFFAAWVHGLRRESQETLKFADQAIALASQNGIAQWLAFSSSLRGWAVAERGQVGDGLQQMRQALDIYRAIGSEISRPHFLGLLAEALLNHGDIDGALASLTEALAAVDSTGQRYYEAELYRLKGRLLQKQHSPSAESEAYYHRAIEIARQQRAKSFELRAAISLSQLWRDQGKFEDARSQLKAIYDWFTEGFDAPDLQDAKVLLDELAD
jgi:predicted ATPase